MRNIRSVVLVKFALLLVLCLETWASDVLPLLEQPSVPNYFIRPGEVLEYNVKIRGITAGTQTVQVDGKRMLDGQEVYHVRSVSKIRRLFKIFYPFSNRSESFIQSENLYPLRYAQQIRDGKYKGNINVNFDPDNQTARIVKDSKLTETDTPPGIQDELSMIYLFRTKEIEVGQKYQFSLLTGDKIMETTISVLRTEEIKTIFGVRDTIVIKTTPKDVTIWLTNNAVRVPVRIEAPTKIGKLVSKLKAMR